MRIFITRHGQTNWNVLKKIQGQTDIELNDNGKMQAIEAGKVLKNEKIDLIITSPLKRAKETAEIINKNFNVSIIEDKRLMERNFGEFEGTTKEERTKLKESYPEINDIWNYNKNVTIDTVETMQELFDRVYKFFDEIKEIYKEKDILIVTHGGTSLPIICYLKKIPLNEVINKDVAKTLDNCEIMKIEI